MKCALLLLAMLSLVGLARADDKTQAVQQALKDQGFYYGTVDGQGGPETDAAIRRYQIRQGLEVSGKLDAQTLASLNLGGNAKSDENTVQAVPPPASDDTSPAQSAPEATPKPEVVQSDHDFLRDQAPATTPMPDEPAPPRAEAVYPESPDQQPPPPAPEPVQPPPPGPDQPPVYEGQTVPPQYARFFRETPYQAAPPMVQRSTIQQAQGRLAREGYYRGVTDGELSDSLSRAIASYQRDDDLRVTGRLDMPTLDDLNLLPRRHVIIRPPPPSYDDGPPVYRGIWVH